MISKRSTILYWMATLYLFLLVTCSYVFLRVPKFLFDKRDQTQPSCVCHYTNNKAVSVDALIAAEEGATRHDVAEFILFKKYLQSKKLRKQNNLNCS